MSLLEDKLRSLARGFGDDLVAALRGKPVESLIEITEVRALTVIVTRKNGKGAPIVALGASAIERAIEGTSVDQGLTEREKAILTLAVRGESRSAISGALGIPENTLKTQTRMLLRKCRVSSLSDAAIAVLHRALGSRAVVLRGQASTRTRNGA